MRKQIIPDRQAIERVQRENPNEPDAERYRLAQADTLIRLAKAKNIDELNRMAEAGLLDDLIDDHNRRAERP